MNEDDVSAAKATAMPTELLNPFVHHLEIDSTYEKIKTIILSVVLLPVRVFIICWLLVTAWLLACFGLWGLSEEELRDKPLTGWRRWMKPTLIRIVYLAFVVGGFHAVRVRGRQASQADARLLVVAPHSSFFDTIAMLVLGAPSVVAKGETSWIPVFGSTVALKPVLCYLGKMTYTVGGMSISVKGQMASRDEAPILVAAPHSTFLDGGIVYITGLPSIIVRRESGMNPYIGKLINYTQPVYVWREDPNSRQNTIREIIDRATSLLDWPQVLIFPEGTCTNRSCLITFKPGAFYPGVPVQPVCIRYPNRLDTVTWTWEGPGALKLLWLTLAQVHSQCEIEFLPVYKPNEEERRNPKLYAENVRRVMAEALGIPVSDYTYDDCRTMTRAKQMNLPYASGLVEAQKLRHKLRLDESNVEERILNSPHILCHDCSQLSYPEFADILQVSVDEPALQQLFKIYDKNSSGVIDFREYLFGIVVLSKSKSTLETLEIAFKIYDRHSRGQLSLEEFSQAVRLTLSMCDDETVETFRQIDSQSKGFVTFEQFQEFARRRPEFSHLFDFEQEVDKSKND